MEFGVYLDEVLRGVKDTPTVFVAVERGNKLCSSSGIRERHSITRRSAGKIPHTNMRKVDAGGGGGELDFKILFITDYTKCFSNKLYTLKV